MNDKINLTNPEGKNLSVDAICFIENTESKKRYLYYTLNELVGNDANSTVKIYVSKMRQNDPALDAPISKEEWDALKGYMADALKGNVNPAVKYIPLKELVDPVSVSEMAIAMPMSYDYTNKQRGVYAQAIATEENSTNVTPAQEPTPAPTLVPEPTPAPPVLEELTPAPMAPNDQQAVVETTPVNLESPSVVQNTGSQPIDIAEIEKKYENMLADINRLKEQEIEAIKRYNATIELSSMHNEQHANYVQNEQNKEVVNPIPNPTPAAPLNNTIETAAPTETQNSLPQEPVPVAPIVPEPVASPSNIETNWFDMPANN